MKCTLKDIVISIQTGPFGSQLHRSDYSDTGIPVIMPQDIINWRISTEKIAYVSQYHVDRLSKHKLEYNDILYPRRGDVSKCAKIGSKETGWLCGTGCLKVKIDADKANPQYIFYYLQQPEIGKWIELHSTGATMMNINSSTLNDLPLNIPTIDIQNKICSIISQYDRFIDNCQKQISLLEETAQRLYKEWFVDFRFPGHESVAITNGLPDGWRTGIIEDLGKFVRGKNILTTEAIKGSVPVIAGGLTPSCWHNQSNTKSPVITVSGSGANAGYTAIHNIEVWAADCSYIDSSMTNDIYYIYCFLRANSELIRSKQRGAAQPHVYAKDLNATDIILPTKTLLGEFNDKACNIFNQIGLLRKLIVECSSARDLLLPRLMSGEIEIKI